MENIDHSDVLVVLGLLGFCVLMAALIFLLFRRLGGTENIKALRESLKVTSHGIPNETFLCPQCGEKGRVSVKSIKVKRGLSGPKVFGAIFTSGVSLLATGIQRKEGMTQAYCSSCNSTWKF